MTRKSLFKSAHLGLVLLGLTGCTQDKFGCAPEAGPTNEPKVPWEKVQAGQEKVRALSAYVAPPGQRLSFTLNSREQKIAGTVLLDSGELQIDPSRLESARGTLAMKLSSLEIESSGADSKETTGPPSTDETDAFVLSTEVAQRWLGLGSDVPADARKPNEWLRYSFSSARNLSQPSAHVGGRVAPSKVEGLTQGKDGHSEVRRVHLTAVGDLELRSLSVHREVPVICEFHYEEAATRSATPKFIDATLRGDVSIPLSEYQILPRDSAGHTITSQLPLLGKRVGSVAQISGTVRFVLRQVPTQEVEKAAESP